MSTKLTDQTIGYLCALIPPLIWAGNFVVARGVHEILPPVGFAFWRWVVALTVVLPFGLKYLRRDWHLVKKHWRHLTLMALFGVTIFNTFIYVASHSTEAINISLIAVNSPVLIVLLSGIFLDEAIRWKQVAGLIFSAAGVLFVITEGLWQVITHMDFVVGDLWALAAAFCWSVYAIFLKKKPSEMHLLTFLLVTFALGLFMLSPFYLWEHFYQNNPVKLSQKGLMAIMYTGVLASFVAFLLWNVATHKVGASRAGFFYYLIPVFSVLMAYIWLGERLNSAQLIGIICIFFGILLATVRIKNGFRLRRSAGH